MKQEKDKPKQSDLKFELNLLEHCVTLAERVLRRQIPFKQAMGTVNSYLRIFDAGRGKKPQT